MIKFNNEEIEYIKNELKEIAEFVSTEEFKKEYGCVEMDKEDTMLLEKYSKDTEDWDKINEDEKINKDIENVCWGMLNMANLSLRHFQGDEVLEMTENEVYANLYVKVGGEEW